MSAKESPAESSSMNFKFCSRTGSNKNKPEKEGFALLGTPTIIKIAAP